MIARPEYADAREAAGQFQATRWSMVLASRQRQTPEGEAALMWLCERYWRPLFAWARAKGVPSADAEDLVQGFFEQALRGGMLERADASRGRFRSFILGCLEHYWTDQIRRGDAVKRGGGATIITFDGTPEEELGEITSGRTPEQEYDHAWARAIIARATSRLEKECDADGHTGRFAILRSFLDGDRGEVPMAGAAGQLELSLPALKSVVHRLRQRMREIIREEVRETIEADGDVEAEMRELICALKS
jgi:RNA polymerase sigma-70 factor (ECF subfamily)